jgi:thioredoxin reductase (NADPH)
MNTESSREDCAPGHQSTLDERAAGEAPGLRNHPRYDQMFPTLTESEVERLRRFELRG